MTWTNLTFSSGSKLTSTKMTQLFDNLQAMAEGDPGAPPIGGGETAKCWVNFNGTTATIRDHYNVASVSNDGTGQYTITWDTDFASTSYVITGTGYSSASIFYVRSAIAVGSVPVNTKGDNGTLYNSAYVYAAAFGDQ